ncbi:MAG: TonB-dependent receptor plug domain-containing protein, partial [Deltaproteobacteria bacterium]|nr:TonB-dependent receptor plug domain-containing protein [Deltaproteobacteria bacterium]
MNQRILFLLLWLLCLPAAAGIALAGEPQPNAAAPVVMDTITVQDKLLSPTSQGGDLLHTGTRVNAAGIALAGAGAPGSIFAALNLLPGVNTEMQDPLGIAGKDMRLRGIRSRYASLSVEGIPNYGIMPIGPRDDIYDLENLESIGVYQGATPLGLGAGSGNRGGAITLEYRRPA